MHMRVHTFIRQYQYRYTNTEGYDDASVMCGDFFILATHCRSILANCSKYLSQQLQEYTCVNFEYVALFVPVYTYMYIGILALLAIAYSQKALLILRISK